MSIKNKAEKKIQIAIDKLIDLLPMISDGFSYRINEALEKLRDIESRICSGEIKNNIIH